MRRHAPEAAGWQTRTRAAASLTCTRVVSKTDGSQSLHLQRGALETAGTDAVNVSTTSRSGVEAQPDLDRDAAPRRVFDCPKFVTATELVTMLVEAQQQGRLTRKLAQLACFGVVPLLCLKAATCGVRDCP